VISPEFDEVGIPSEADQLGREQTDGASYSEGRDVYAQAAVGDDLSDGSPSVGPRLTFCRADTVTPARPVWLWERWICAGALHVLVGRQGGGKTTFAAWLVGVLSAGREFPDDLTPRAAVRCALLSLEEPSERLVARLHATEADVSQVYILGDVEDVDPDGRSFRRPWCLPKDCAVLEARLREQNVRFVVVDGLGYSVTGDSHNYANVGAALSSLAGVCDRTGAAVLGLTHPPKGASDPVTAAIGSTAWTAIPRVVWVLGTDPEDESEKRRAVRVSKTNFKEPDHGLSFIISDNEEYECGQVTGLAPSNVSAQELVAASVPSEERTEREEARELLRAILADGRVDVKEVYKSSRSAGISDRTMSRARSDLGVVAHCQRHPKTGCVLGWFLSLPEQSNIDPATPECALPIGAVGGLGTTRQFAGSGGPERQAAGRGTLADEPPLAEAEIDRYFGVEDEEATPVATSTGKCDVCGAPPPRHSTFGWSACEHQIASGMVPE